MEETALRLIGVGAKPKLESSGDSEEDALKLIGIETEEFGGRGGYGSSSMEDEALRLMGVNAN